MLEIRKIPFSQVPIDSKLVWASVLIGIYDKRHIQWILSSAYIVPKPKVFAREIGYLTDSKKVVISSILLSRSMEIFF